jgi:hypothetical protein
MLDIRRALQFLTEDEKGTTKIAIGGLLMAIPIANFIAVGYEVETTRRVARNEARPLPEWNDLSGLFATGAWLSLARFVYALPIVLVLFGGMATWFVFVFQAVQSEGEPAPIFGQAAIAAMFCGIGIVAVYGLLLAFLSPAILAEYARRGTFASCFDFSNIKRFIWRDPSRYALAWLAELGLGLAIGLASFVIASVLSVIPCLGSLAMMIIFGIAAFVIILFHSHLAGQLMQAGDYPELAKET